jgi:hypothetical protein
MNELIALVSQRSGLSLDESQKAVMVIIDILKQRLPAPLASHIDSLVTGGAAGLEAEAGELLKGAIGGFFGSHNK